jgi:hypothetical protein
LDLGFTRRLADTGFATRSIRGLKAGAEVDQVIILRWIVPLLVAFTPRELA